MVRLGPDTTTGPGATSDPNLRGAENRFRFVQWDITSRCNLRCIHCRSKSFYGDGALRTDLPFEAVCARVDELHKAGVRRVHFLGGEPFTRRDLADIVRYASERGILCSINTNGTLITEEVAEEIVSAGTYLVTFSIDGPTAETNDRIRGVRTFSRVIRGIRNVHRARDGSGSHLRTICSFVLMRPNADSAPDMISLCTDLGLCSLLYSGVRRMGGAARIFNELRIPEEETLDIAERIAERAVSLARKCTVDIGFTSLLGKLYLNARFGLGMPISFGGCDAISTKGYVQPDGSIYPCQDVAVLVKQLSEPTDASGSGAAWPAGRFTSILESRANGSVFARYTPCNVCPALGRLCVPCPLPGLRGRAFAQRACQNAMERARRWGVDIKPKVEEAAHAAARDRILRDPLFRRAFFAGSAAAAAPLGPTGTGDAEGLARFRDEALAEVQSILAEAAHTGA